MKLFKKIFDVFINFFIVLTTIHSIGANVVMRLSQGVAPTFYRTFSFDVNIVVSIFCIITLFYTLPNIKKENIVIPKWLAIAKLVTTTSIIFCFFIVMLWLGPFVEGFDHMLSTKLLFLHLFNPIFALISFCFLENEEKFEFKWCFLPIVPILAFGVIYILCAYVIGIWKIIYPLSLWVILLMFLLTVGIPIGLFELRKIKFKT